jgi:hypothetical protein
MSKELSIQEWLALDDEEREKLAFKNALKYGKPRTVTLPRDGGRVVGRVVLEGGRIKIK